MSDVRYELVISSQLKVRRPDPEQIRRAHHEWFLRSGQRALEKVRARR